METVERVFGACGEEFAVYRVAISDIRVCKGTRWGVEAKDDGCEWWCAGVECGC